MNYEFGNYWSKYKILLKYEQNTYLIQIDSLVFVFFQCFGLLQVRGMRFHCANGTAQLRTLKGVLVVRNALCWQQCFFSTHVSLHIV